MSLLERQSCRALVPSDGGAAVPAHGQKAKPCQAAAFARGDFGQYFCLSRSFPIPRLRPIVDTNGELNTS